MDSEIEPYKCPLNSVCKFGDLGMVELILSIPDKSMITCAVNIPSSPLHIACERESIDLAKLVLKHSKDLGFTINDNQSLCGLDVFHYSCKYGKVDMVKFFLELPEEYELYYYGDPDCDDQIYTPFSSACLKEHLDVIKLLLDYSMRLDTKIDYLPHLGRAIRVAACDSSWKTFEFLLDYVEGHSISINLIDKDKELYCLTKASMENRLDMVQLIMEYLTKTKITPKNLKQLNFNRKMTPLHWAAYKGHLDIVKYFVENKTFKLTQKDDGGKTPIMRARNNGHQDVVNYLNRALHPSTWRLSERKCPRCPNCRKCKY